MHRLAISIVTYNTDENLLRRCLSSIINSSVSSIVQIIDNSPMQHSEAAAKLFNTSYVHLPHNPGYGAGHNHAIRQSIQNSVDYHLVLNADVWFDTDVLEVLLNYMDKNLIVAHVMPKILNPDGSIQRLCKLVPTPFDLLIRRFLPKFMTSNARHRFELRESGYDRVMFVPYLSGCFMFLRCSALEQVGLFDERYFMYPEDIDLTRRLANRFEAHYYPHISAIHAHEAASYKSLRMAYIHIKNIIKYFNKWGWIYDRERSRLNKKTLKQFIKLNDC